MKFNFNFENILKIWGPLIDSITSNQWLSKCNAANQYYKYLEDQLVLFNDNNVWVTYTRLNSILGCKTDCNFVRLLSVSSSFTVNTQNFAKNVVQFLPPLAASSCRLSFPALTSQSLSATNLINNLGIYIYIQSIMNKIVLKSYVLYY